MAKDEALQNAINEFLRLANGAKDRLAGVEGGQPLSDYIDLLDDAIEAVESIPEEEPAADAVEKEEEADGSD